MNSGIRPNLVEVFGQHVAEDRAEILVLGRGCRRRNRRPSLPTRFSTIFSMPANAPPQMNRMFVVSICRNSWCGCLRPPCGGTAADGALEDLEQRLLHALAGHVAGDRRVLALAGDLVDLVDVDDAGLGLLDVVVGGLDQLEEDVLDVFADVAGLGERVASAIANGTLSMRASVCASRSCRSRWGRSARCWTSQLDVAVELVAEFDALVVVVDGDGQDPLRLVLTDDVVVQEA